MLSDCNLPENKKYCNDSGHICTNDLEYVKEQHTNQMTKKGPKFIPKMIMATCPYQNEKLECELFISTLNKYVDKAAETAEWNPAEFNEWTNRVSI